MWESTSLKKRKASPCFESSLPKKTRFRGIQSKPRKQSDSINNQSDPNSTKLTEQVVVCGAVTRVSVWSAVFYCVPNVGGKCFGDSESKLLNSKY